MPTQAELATLADFVKQTARDLGFSACGITDTQIPTETLLQYQAWLDAGYHGDMDYLERNLDKRAQPALLVEGSTRIICVRMDYLPAEIDTLKVLQQGERAYISRYALGRDYHKLIRKRLTQLGQALQQKVADLGFRAFVDSAPVLERPLAQDAGLGWIGKNTLVIHPRAGSLFFLGELFISLPLPVDPPYTREHCGQCDACQRLCPTQAFVAPYVLDARRCISYLTIEYSGSIPLALRPLIGNRIFGCDDCQLVCPWNRFSQPTQETDFSPRHHLDRAHLLDLLAWTPEEFLTRTQGSPIRRAGYRQWQRNLAIALGNAPYHPKIYQALVHQCRQHQEDALLLEHFTWAWQQQSNKQAAMIEIHPE